MGGMKLRFLGSGDAFGSGGRLNTCFHVDRGSESVLIDCGASAMIAIRRFGIDPNAIGTIVLSHLHGDHFGGLPFFILDAQLVSLRERPLVIAGPQGLAARLDALMEAMFPGSTKATRKFPIELAELSPAVPTAIGKGAIQVTGFVVSHPSGTDSLALRIACDGRIVAYTGDTEWVDTLVAAGAGADLLIAEAYWYERKVRFHLDFATLRANLPRIGAKRVAVTHMSPDMLTRLDDLGGIEPAYDGLTLEIE